MAGLEALLRLFGRAPVVVLDGNWCHVAAITASLESEGKRRHDDGGRKCLLSQRWRQWTAT